MALVDTRSGCTTSSSRMFEMRPCTIVSDKMRIVLRSKTCLADVDTSVLLPERMPIAEFGDNGDGVEAGIFGERRRDNL